ncbi:unnamed protein product [Meganyctiphanes norvegica]|uniref:Uncharacterized protein n=1 Tax=Meganyctiphanes norvegica TaxID=48144 RepID=A0AAV2RZN8_MEGNR
MEVTLFIISIAASLVYGRSYEMHDLDEYAPSGASFAYSDGDYENLKLEFAKVNNVSKRSYSSETKNICWLSGPSFALRSEEELLYQPYENQTDLILTSRDCLPQPLKITIHHEHISTKVLHFSISNLLFIFMDNQIIFKTRRNIVSRLFCKMGHSSITFSLANKWKESYKHIHRFGKKCPKTFLNNSQIRNYHNNHRRIPHMDLLFGIMIILVILVTCFLRLIYWFRIKALSQERQLRSQQRRQLIDLTRPSRVNRRIELPPSYNEVQQQEEPPPSYDTVYKRLLATSETPSVHYKTVCDGESPRLECVSDPPPEYHELYENLATVIDSEPNTNCQVDCNTLPGRNRDVVTGTSSSNYEEASFSICNTNCSDQVSLKLEEPCKSDLNSTVVNDKVGSVRLEPQTSCSKDEDISVPLNVSNSDNFDIATESTRLPESETNVNESSTSKSTNGSINV